MSKGQAADGALQREFFPHCSAPHRTGSRYDTTSTREKRNNQHPSRTDQAGRGPATRFLRLHTNPIASRFPYRQVLPHRKKRTHARPKPKVYTAHLLGTGVRGRLLVDRQRNLVVRWSSSLVMRQNKNTKRQGCFSCIYLPSVFSEYSSSVQAFQKPANVFLLSQTSNLAVP